MTYPLLSVILLNHNRTDDTLACLASLAKSDYKNFKILLLDYSPQDNHSLEVFQREFPQVHAFSLRENLGYSGNNNIGIRASMEQGAEWLLILNNDTILDPSCLSHLIEAGESDPAIGIVGPMVYHFDEPMVIQSAGGRLDRYWRGDHLGKDEQDHGQFTSVRPVDWISGCAILVRRGVIEQVGALDPDYFLYWEEIEWCIRAQKAGWKMYHVPQARLWHKGVQRDYQPRPYVTYYMTRNYLHTLSKHRAPFWIRTYAIVNVLRMMVSWSVKPRWRNKRDHRDAMWKGTLDFFHRRLGPMQA